VRDNSKLLAFLVIPVAMAGMFVFANGHPGFFNNETYFGALLGMQVLVLVLWHYEVIFFPAMMFAFLWAGTDLPLSGIGTMGRWVLLIVGACVGFVKWLKQAHRRPLGAMHVVAGLCILAAAVSSDTSAHMHTSVLKTLSLALLFLYGAAGARVAVLDREAVFFRGLTKVCEVLAWLSAILYFGLHFEVFGSSNSLGAIMAVVVIPVLLWTVLSARERTVRYRFIVALVVAWALLFYSVARAGILAAIVSSALMCLCLRKGKILFQGAFVVLLLAAALAVVQPTHFGELADSFTEDLVYKGKREEGLLGSRRSPWEDTRKVIRESPWFGSGYGTDLGNGSTTTPEGLFRNSSSITGEHGSSYLTLLQYVGALGIVPFLCLFALILTYIRRVCQRMWRSGDASDYAIPLAFICFAGLIHAGFEDWLVAVGYYLNVFFWTSAFLLSDFQRRSPVPQTAPVRAPQPAFAPVIR
jgi:O-antigen ligase